MNYRADRTADEFFPSTEDSLVVVPLTDPRCADGLFAGDDVAVTALVADLLVVPPTLVVTGPLTAWRGRLGPVPLGPDVVHLIRRTDRAVTLRAWVVAPDGAARPVGPTFYNVDRPAVGEAMAEFAALGLRDPDVTAAHGLTISLQRFTAADVSVQVTVAKAEGPVVLRSSWGIGESSDAGPWQDVLELTGPELSTGMERLVYKPTATVADTGGTRTTEVPVERRVVPALPADRARPLARAARSAAQRLRRGAEFEIALAGGSPYLLTGRFR